MVGIGDVNDTVGGERCIRGDDIVHILRQGDRLADLSYRSGGIGRHGERGTNQQQKS